MTSRMHLVVMAKYPAPGLAKTRLAADVGPEGAVRLGRAFIADLHARLSELGPEFVVWWALWPAGAPFGDLVDAPRTFAQCEGDLGARMARASAHVRAVSDGGVAIIGTDAPHLPLERIREARGALADGADAVVGPALDGGYYLIATTKPAPGLFEGIAWGTPSVLAETRQRARDGGLRLAELASDWDVDDARDLRRLRAFVRTRPGVLPRTERALAEID